MYATSIGDILKRFSLPSKDDGDSNNDGGLIVSVLGDVTYGACCIGDLDAKALGCDLLVHYGHSCLVPMTTTAVPCLYVFVEIRIDVRHFVECVVASVPVGTRCELMGTIQFRSAVAEAAKLLNSDSEMYGGARPCRIPQAKPLSPGEVLGCTAPTIVESDDSDVETVLLFIADGRFHLEAAMIANPKLRALRYDPYSKVLTEEGYDHDHMKRLRLVAIKQAARENVKVFGIILGTLGRQGNPAILSNIRRKLKANGKKSFVILMSEVFPKKLQMLPQADAWVQVACPRLSIDWGHFFDKPVLSSYELEVCLGEASSQWSEMGSNVPYPMDFYSRDSGIWTNYHDHNKDRVFQHT